MEIRLFMTPPTIHEKITLGIIFSPGNFDDHTVVVIVLIP